MKNKKQLSIFEQLDELDNLISKQMRTDFEVLIGVDKKGNRKIKKVIL